MVAHIKTVVFHGVDAVPVDVQVHLAPGQNAFNVVGLPDKSIAESRERVRAALQQAGLHVYGHERLNKTPACKFKLVSELAKSTTKRVIKLSKWFCNHCMDATNSAPLTQ